MYVCMFCECLYKYMHRETINLVCQTKNYFVLRTNGASFYFRMEGNNDMASSDFSNLFRLVLMGIDIYSTEDSILMYGEICR